MVIDVLTLFPSMFQGPLSESILKLAQQRGIVEVRLTDIRNYTEDRHRSVDDKPYGGGPGMVMMCPPVFAAVEAVKPVEGVAPRRILLTPQGRRLDQRLARELSAERHLVLVCGHYEGFDERIRIGLGAEEVSIGDYVLSGGELPAMVIIDAVVRLLPGALGNEQSAAQDSFEDGLLDFPQYTRPPVFRGMPVPEVLLSGHHQKVAEWRREQAQQRTSERRPDLLRTEEDSPRRLRDAENTGDVDGRDSET
jgi:tRNA (guanine37-N1)-methyltransferase